MRMVCCVIYSRIISVIFHLHISNNSKSVEIVNATSTRNVFRKITLHENKANKAYSFFWGIINKLVFLFSSIHVFTQKFIFLFLRNFFVVFIFNGKIFLDLIPKTRIWICFCVLNLDHDNTHRRSEYKQIKHATKYQ